MATNQNFINYICEQIAPVGEIRFRKMFGEYMVYCNNKPIFLVCDNTVFAKMVQQVLPLLADAETGFPYPGEKLHYVVDVDNTALICDVATILEQITPLPKKKLNSK